MGTTKVYFNDLETDGSSSEWQDSLQAVTSNQRQFLWVKKNMFTSMVVVDPGSSHGLFTLAMMGAYLNNGLPARTAAVVLAEPPSSREEGWASWADDALQAGAGKAPVPGQAPAAPAAGAASSDEALERSAKARRDGNHATSYMIAKCFHFLVDKEGARRLPARLPACRAAAPPRASSSA